MSAGAHRATDGHRNNVHVLTPSEHEAKVDSLDDLHRRKMGEAKDRIRNAEQHLVEQHHQVDKQIAELERRKVEIETDVRLRIAADRRLVAKCHAFLAAGE